MFNIWHDNKVRNAQQRIINNYLLNKDEIGKNPFKSDTVIRTGNNITIIDYKGVIIHES